VGSIKPTLLRYTRPMFTEYLKKRMQDLLDYGPAMEGLALMEQIHPAKSKVASHMALPARPPS
jgi:hypothetical protein